MTNTVIVMSQTTIVQLSFLIPDNCRMQKTTKLFQVNITNNNLTEIIKQSNSQMGSYSLDNVFKFYKRFTGLITSCHATGTSKLLPHNN